MVLYMICIFELQIKRFQRRKTLQNTIVCIYELPESVRKSIPREIVTFKTEYRNQKRAYDKCSDGDAKMETYQNIVYKPSCLLSISAITEVSIDGYRLHPLCSVRRGKGGGATNFPAV